MRQYINTLFKFNGDFVGKENSLFTLEIFFHPPIPLKIFGLCVTSNRYAINLITDKHLIHLDDYDDGGRIVINLSIPSNTSQVFASVALFLVIPYQPW